MYFSDYGERGGDDRVGTIEFQDLPPDRQAKSGFEAGSSSSLERKLWSIVVHPASGNMFTLSEDGWKVGVDELDVGYSILKA